MLTLLLLPLILVPTYTKTAVEKYLAYDSNQADPAYGIVDYYVDTSGSITYVTKKIDLFGENYTKFKIICGGDLMTLILGSGRTYEMAVENAATKGNAALLIGGTGNDVPRIACELVGTRRD